VFGVFSARGVFSRAVPDHIRSTGVASATVPGGSSPALALVAGLGRGVWRQFQQVTAFMSCFALLSVIAMMLGRETKNDELRATAGCARRGLVPGCQPCHGQKGPNCDGAGMLHR